jgi:hypothetical protein
MKYEGPAAGDHRAFRCTVDQVRVRILIMKVSNPSSETCSQAKESLR